MRLRSDPVPPRYIFDDESSSDEDPDLDPSKHQVSEYQDEEPTKAEMRRKLLEPPEIEVSLTEQIHDNPTVIIGVELLQNVNDWFDVSKEIGTFSTQTGDDKETISLPIHFCSQHDIYTVSIKAQIPMNFAPYLAHKILDTLQPRNFVVVASSSAIPSTIPISLLRTSTPATAAGGVTADAYSLFSNRRLVRSGDIQARIRAAQNPKTAWEIPLLQPPKMILGIAASLMSLAEVHGIHATCFIFSSWIGEDLERRDAERFIAHLTDVLKGIRVDVNDVLKGWRQSFGVSWVDKSSIYI